MNALWSTFAQSANVTLSFLLLALITELADCCKNVLGLYYPFGKKIYHPYLLFIQVPLMESILSCLLSSEAIRDGQRITSITSGIRIL